MHVTRILHVSQGVGADIDTAARFYVDFLGLPVLTRPGTITTPGLWLGLDEAQLHLNGRVAGSDPGVGPHPDHLCLGVDDLAAAIRHLESAGISFVVGGSLAQQQVWLRDPAGNTIELQQDHQ